MYRYFNIWLIHTMKIRRTIQVLQTSGELHDVTFSQLKAARVPQIKTQKTEMKQTQLFQVWRKKAICVPVRPHHSVRKICFQGLSDSKVIFQFFQTPGVTRQTKGNSYLWLALSRGHTLTIFLNVTVSLCLPSPHTAIKIILKGHLSPGDQVPT